MLNKNNKLRLLSVNYSGDTDGIRYSFYLNDEVQVFVGNAKKLAGIRSVDFSLELGNFLSFLRHNPAFVKDLVHLTWLSVGEMIGFPIALTGCNK